MKKILMSILLLVILTSCSYNATQPKDDAYYKRTQGIAWPEK